MLYRPTTMGDALYAAANRMESGGNTPLARVVRSKIALNAPAFSVAVVSTLPRKELK
jgi:hypothetical protein